MFENRKNQIVLYSTDYSETVIDLESAHHTDNINAYISYMKCINMDQYYLRKGNEELDIEEGSKGLYSPVIFLAGSRDRQQVSDAVRTLYRVYS